jgi:preprotein translocase subunit Sss1
MDHKLSHVLTRSNTPDTEEHNALTLQTGIAILDPLLEESIG